jgi:hypothetical protein
MNVGVRDKYENSRGELIQSPQRGIRRSWVIAALAIVAAFAAGIYVNSQFLASTAGNNQGVSDTYPVGECLGTCPQHNYVFNPDTVTVTITHLGKVVYQSTSNNLITNAGEKTIIDGQMACGAAGAPPACSATGPVYIALTSLASPTPALTDTTCFNGNEYASGNGMNRALGTYVSGSQSSPYTHIIKNTFTYTGAVPLTITGVCMFNAASGATLFAEDALGSTATVSASGDQLTITWTFTH